ncbi:hypothetical protein KL942_001366 [Ogataea angusta]|uniref:Uncharacterized protein n=1 Tax=Pichia angusta TaxID=870730 RepID=A0ABQ7S0P7_PICAN|nr:hypothetical protein KL942_001366 [Ogataea angusta]KAG7850936.1 hypothetical protein KL940_001513 [Ogataea angusta]
MNNLSNAAALAALRKHSSTSNLTDHRSSSYNPNIYRSSSMTSSSFRPGNSRTNSLTSNSSRYTTGFTTTTTTTTKKLPSSRLSTPTKIVKTTKEQDAEGRTRSITKTTIEQKDGFEVVKTTVVKPSIVENYNDLGSIAEGFDEEFYHEEEPLPNNTQELENIQEEPTEPEKIELRQQKQPQPETHESAESARTHTYRQLTQSKVKPRTSLSPARIILKNPTPDDDSDGQSIYSDANEANPNAVKNNFSEKVTEEIRSYASSTAGNSPVIPQRSAFRAPSALAPRANSITSNTSSMRKQVKIMGPDPAESRYSSSPPAPAVPLNRPTPEELYQQAYQVAMQKVYGARPNSLPDSGSVTEMDVDTQKNTLLNSSSSQNGRTMSLTQKPVSPVPATPTYQSNAAGVGFRTHTLRGELDAKEEKKLKAAQHKEEKKKLKEIRKEQKGELSELSKQRKSARKNVDDFSEKKRIFSFKKKVPSTTAENATDNSITVTLPLEEEHAANAKPQKSEKAGVGRKFKKFFNL